MKLQVQGSTIPVASSEVGGRRSEVGFLTSGCGLQTSDFRLQTTGSRQQRQRAFSLIELCLAVFIMAIVFTGIIQGNMQAARRAEWSGYSLAANALANQQIEQCRSAIWDNGAWPPVNQLATMNLLNWVTNAAPANGNSYTVGSGYSWADLDLPRIGTNRVRATNWVTIRMINLNNSTNPPVRVQMIQVDTAWPFNQFRRTTRYFTNSLVTYIAPDDRSPGSF